MINKLKKNMIENISDILFLSIFVIILVVMILIIGIDSYKTKEANTQLKKEKYQCQQELKKVKNQLLNELVKTN